MGEQNVPVEMVTRDMAGKLTAGPEKVLCGDGYCPAYKT